MRKEGPWAGARAGWQLVVPACPAAICSDLDSDNFLEKMYRYSCLLYRLTSLPSNTL